MMRPVGRLSLRLLEHRIGIYGDGEVLARLTRCFESSAVDSEPDSSVRDERLIVRVSKAPGGDSAGEQPIGVTTSPTDALAERMRPGVSTPIELARALVQWAVDHTSHYVFHAGSVRRADLGILLPADSRSGKSTIAAALGQRGFGLLSDEVGVVEFASTRLLAFPRALSLRSDVLGLLDCSESAGASFDGGASRMLRASELGIARAESSVVSLIVFPHYESGAVTELRRLTTGPAVLALMKSSCSQARFKVAGLDFVIELARRTPCYELRFSDLWRAIDLIEGVCAELRAVPANREARANP